MGVSEIQRFVSYPTKNEIKLSKVLKMQKAETDLPAVLVAHGYLLCAEGGWKAWHAVQNHTYTLLEARNLTNAVALAYEWSLESKEEGFILASNVPSRLESFVGQSDEGGDCGSPRGEPDELEAGSDQLIEIKE